MKWRFADAEVGDFHPVPDGVGDWLTSVSSDECFVWCDSAEVMVGPCPECGTELGRRTRAKFGIRCEGCNTNLEWGLLEVSEAEKIRCDWTGSGEGILIVGPVGVGKTHLAAGMRNYLEAKTVPVRWISCTDLAWEARVAIGRGDTDDPYHVAAQVPGVLVLDDIGAVKYVTASGEPTHAHDGIAHVLRHRYDYLLPTIITAHQSLSRLAEHVGIGIASRLQQMAKVELAGSDRRAELRRRRNSQVAKMNEGRVTT